MGYKAKHAKPVKSKRALAAIPAALAITATTMLAAPATPAHASTETLGAHALDWAEAHAYGKPYVWGGTGPYGYDCSGLVYAALRAVEGASWPSSVRDTYEMLASWHLYRVYYPQRGDLAFYGTGHVEFVTNWYHETFGAHNSGTTVGWIRYNPQWGWAPTMFFRVR